MEYWTEVCQFAETCGRTPTCAVIRERDGAVACFCEMHYGMFMRDPDDSDETYRFTFRLHSTSLMDHLGGPDPALAGEHQPRETEPSEPPND